MTRIFINRTENYYKRITDAREGIDNELTISHLLRSRNPFTKSGLPYGRILAEKLGIRDGARILEVGPGLGDVAENICSSFADIRYTFVDVSYAFMNHLKSKFTGDKFSFITGDFLTTKIRGKFDFIISNEVLADLPTIVGMRFGAAHESDEYYDAVALAKFYGLSERRIRIFNYGAVKFLEKAKSLLAENGKIFICEHSSSPPRRIRVAGHTEYTVDFGVLERIAKRLRFEMEKGSLTELLGIKNRKAVILYMHPELKTLYHFLRKQGIFLEQKVYDVEEILEALESHGVHIRGRKAYADFLGKHAKPLREITDQFGFLILKS